MTTRAPTTEESVSRIAFWPLWIIGRVTGAVLMLTFVALLMYGASVHFSAKTGVTPERVEAVYRHTIETAARSGSPLPEKIGHWTYTMFIKGTGLHSSVVQQDGPFSNIASRYPDEVAAIMMAALIVGMRLGDILLTMPFIILVIALATVDGLAERRIRSACGGHESAGVFRLARRLAYTLIPPAVALIYLCLPIDLDQATVLYPAMALTAVMIRTKWKYFKKHM